MLHYQSTIFMAFLYAIHLRGSFAVLYYMHNWCALVCPNGLYTFILLYCTWKCETVNSVQSRYTTMCKSLSFLFYSSVLHPSVWMRILHANCMESPVYIIHDALALWRRTSGEKKNSNLYHTRGLKHESQFFIWFSFNSCSHVIRFQAKWSVFVCLLGEQTWLQMKCNAKQSDENFMQNYSYSNDVQRDDKSISSLCLAVHHTWVLIIILLSILCAHEDLMKKGINHMDDVRYKP